MTTQTAATSETEWSLHDVRESLPAWIERTFGTKAASFPWELIDQDRFRIDETTEDGELVVRAELPGVDPEEIDVRVDGPMLHIRAERRAEEVHEDGEVRRREIHYGAMSRTLPLPHGARTEDIAAIYEAGMLTVRIPLPEEDENTSTRIPIQS